MFSFFRKFAYCESEESIAKIPPSPYEGLTLEDMRKLKRIESHLPRPPREIPLGLGLEQTVQDKGLRVVYVMDGGIA